MERGGFAAAATPAIGARTTYAALALLTLAALALKLFRIDAASYWADELFSVFWVRESLGFLWSAEAFEIETTPPLYYTLLKPWAAAFGSSELAIRSFSAVLSAATIPLVWRLAREFAGPGTALLAAAIFALNPMQMQFAQEARAYALIPPLYSLAARARAVLPGGASAAGRGAGPVWYRGARAGLCTCDLGLHPGGAEHLRRALAAAGARRLGTAAAAGGGGCGRGGAGHP